MALRKLILFLRHELSLGKLMLPSCRKLLFFLILIFIFFDNSLAFFGQPQIEQKEQKEQIEQETVVITQDDVQVIAKTYSRDKNQVFASGNVEVKYRNIKLLADRIELNTETKDVLATGHVVIQTQEEVVTADWISFNLNNTQGKLENAFGLVQPSLRYQAASIERKADNLYAFGKSQFTSCSQPVPRWKFSCSRANFKKDDYIEMWGALFSIKKIPVFYLPYMKYPLDKERATGFLMPQIGYSEAKGFSYSQSFYWALARNMDATFSLDYYSARGVGAGLEYRYLFSRGTGGNVSLYYFNFKKNPLQAGSSHAYLIRLDHNQPLPLGFNLLAEIDYQSSFDFLREFDNNFARATVTHRRSQVYISKAWSSFNFNLRASRFETSFPGGTGETNSIIAYYLPQLSLNSFKIKLFSPLYFSFSSSFSRWQYGWQSEYEAGTEAHLQSFLFNPVLSLPFTSIPWLTANFSLETNLAYYWQTYKFVTQDSGGPSRKIVDEPLFSRNYAFNVELAGPVIYRIWDIGGKKENSAGKENEKQSTQGNIEETCLNRDSRNGKETSLDKTGEQNSDVSRNGSESSQAGEPMRLKHIIEPFLSYRYETPVESSERIITPYGFFRFHELRYGLSNQVLLKQERMPKEVFTLSLSQVFYFAPESSPLSLYRVNGKIPRFSEVSAYLRFYPVSKYSLDLSANYNPYYKNFSSLRLGANLVPSDLIFLNVSWFKSINSWERGNIQFLGDIPYSLWDRHQISLFGGAKIPFLSLEAQGQMDFNVVERKLLYSAFSFVYHYQCLDLKVDLRYFYFREKPLEFRVSVGLGNIGKTTDILGGWESK